MEARIKTIILTKKMECVTFLNHKFRIFNCIQHWIIIICYLYIDGARKNEIISRVQSNEIVLSFVMLATIISHISTYTKPIWLSRKLFVSRTSNIHNKVSWNRRYNNIIRRPTTQNLLFKQKMSSIINVFSSTRSILDPLDIQAKNFN